MYKKSKILKGLRENLEKGAGLYNACAAMRIDFVTLWLWRKKFTRVDNYIERILEGRNQLVEDSLYKTALEGNTTAQIFWLTNRASDKWADKRAVVNNVVVNKLTNNNGNFAGSDKELQDTLLRQLENSNGRCDTESIL